MRILRKYASEILEDNPFALINHSLGTKLSPRVNFMAM